MTYTARELMRMMEDGKIPRSHLGRKSLLVLKQEIFSLKNESGKIMTKKESKEWLHKITSALDLLYKEYPNEGMRIIEEIEQMLAPNTAQTNIRQALGE